MENKYKVGDRVQVKSFEELKEEFDIKHDIDYYQKHLGEFLFSDNRKWFTPTMLKFCGKITRIEKVDDCSRGVYSLECSPDYAFTDGMLKPVEFEYVELKLDSNGFIIDLTNDKVSMSSDTTENSKNELEERKMEDIKLLNVYEEKGLFRLKELKDKEYESIINAKSFIAKFRVITDVYNNACKELFESQHREEPDLDIYPIRKNNYGNGCDYVIDDEYLDKIDEEVIEKYAKLGKDFADNVNECRMQVRLIQQTSNSYDDIMKVLKLYNIIDDNGKVVTYEPTIVEEKKEEKEVKPKRKYTKRKQVNEDNSK